METFNEILPVGKAGVGWGLQTWEDCDKHSRAMGPVKRGHLTARSGALRDRGQKRERHGKVPEAAQK